MNFLQREKKSRQIERSSVLYNLNVNKVSRINATSVFPAFLKCFVMFGFISIWSLEALYGLRAVLCFHISS